MKGTCKLSDYGVTKSEGYLSDLVAGSPGSKVCMNSTDLIKLGYLDSKDDIWSLGYVVQEMWCGENSVQHTHASDLVGLTCSSLL